MAYSAEFYWLRIVLMYVQMMMKQKDMPTVLNSTNYWL